VTGNVLALYTQRLTRAGFELHHGHDGISAIHPHSNVRVVLSLTSPHCSILIGARYEYRSPRPGTTHDYGPASATRRAIHLAGLAGQVAA
jgi:hypothetical protein